MTKKKTANKKQELSPTVLIVLDGFGFGDQKDPGNAIRPDTAPHICTYMHTYPSTTLTAHGKAVGLFPGQEGNSEAGHFAIGAGRVVEQDLVTISHAIDNGTFFKNPALKQVAQQVKKQKGAMHIMGLLTNGQSAHAHPDHLYACLELCRREEIKDVYIHLFTDGRDSSQHQAIAFLGELHKHLESHEQIASIMGRFYAMDRNKLWERTKKAYHAIVLAQAEYTASSPEEAIVRAYDRGESDEYIEPTIIKRGGKPIAKIQDGDGVIFFNARSDRARQITKAFVQKDFNKKNPGSFKRKKVLKNVPFAAMSEFGPDLPGIQTAFPSPDIPNCLAKAIGEGRTQLYISETEKYAHATYFLNGGFADPINGEERELVRSGDQYSYAKKPEMMTKKVVKKIITYIKNDTYNFIFVNFPNADMVGHTGDIRAAEKAVGVIDEAVKEIVDVVTKQGGEVIITADHGNAEEMIDKKTGEALTEHSTNPVPFIVISDKIKKKKITRKGSLIDVAPTVLTLMGLPVPKEMTGKSLI